MPQAIGGEINFFPGAVDLNMARDTIIANDRSSQVKASVAKGVKTLLKRAVAEKKPRIKTTLRDILMIYLQKSLQYEEGHLRSPKPVSSDFWGRDDVPLEPLPLTSAEAAELLLDVWDVKIDNKHVTFREALQIIQRRNVSRVYWHPQLFEKPIPVLFKQSLIQRGFLVIESDSDAVEFRPGKSVWTDHKAVLTSLAKRYNFEIIPIETPRKEDLAGLLVELKTLAPTTQRIIHEIKKSKRKEIRVGRLRDAPAAFHLAGYDYLNLDNEVFKQVNASSEHYDSSSLKAYILGLLQYELF
jgi:hypothetical protein